MKVKEWSRGPESPVWQWSAAYAGGDKPQPLLSWHILPAPGSFVIWTLPDATAEASRKDLNLESIPGLLPDFCESQI